MLMAPFFWNILPLTSLLKCLLLRHKIFLNTLPKTCSCSVLSSSRCSFNFLQSTCTHLAFYTFISLLIVCFSPPWYRYSQINIPLLRFFFGCTGSLLLHSGFSLVEASGGYPLLRCTGFSLWWLLLLQSTGSRCTGSRAQAQ